MDRGAWWATVHRVAQSWTQLKQLSLHTLIKSMSGALAKNSNTWAFVFFKKFQDNSDMHLDFKK